MKKPKKVSSSQTIEDLKNPEIVTLALASLGGAAKKVYTEEIAERAFELAPDKFSWRLEKYRKRNWPQIFLVKNALEDAKKPKNGAWVQGCSTTVLKKDGWSLTPEGAAWARGRETLLEHRKPSASVVPKADRKRIKRRLGVVRKSVLYQQFIKDGSLADGSVYAFVELLNSSPAASKNVLLQKYTQLAAQANLIDDQDIARFFESCREEFGHLMGDQPGRNSL